MAKKLTERCVGFGLVNVDDETDELVDAER